MSNLHNIALDATYSIGDTLSGVGLYSREILMGLACAHPEVRFDFCYRPHRYLRARARRAAARTRGGACWPNRWDRAAPTCSTA